MEESKNTEKKVQLTETPTAFMSPNSSGSEHSEIGSVSSESSWSDLDASSSVNNEDLELDRFQRECGFSNEFIEQARSILHAPVDVEEGELPPDAPEAVMKCVENVCEDELNREVL